MFTSNPESLSPHTRGLKLIRPCRGPLPQWKTSWGQPPMCYLKDLLFNCMFQPLFGSAADGYQKNFSDEMINCMQCWRFTIVRHQEFETLWDYCLRLIWQGLKYYADLRGLAKIWIMRQLHRVGFESPFLYTMAFPFVGFVEFRHTYCTTKYTLIDNIPGTDLVLWVTLKIRNNYRNIPNPTGEPIFFF